MKVYVAVGFNGLFNGLVMAAFSTREKAVRWISEQNTMEQSPRPVVNEVEVDYVEGT